jgi:hypothetical protein
VLRRSFSLPSLLCVEPCTHLGPPYSRFAMIPVCLGECSLCVLGSVLSMLARSLQSGMRHSKLQISVYFVSTVQRDSVQAANLEEKHRAPRSRSRLDEHAERVDGLLGGITVGVPLYSRGPRGHPVPRRTLVSSHQGAPRGQCPQPR